MGTIASHQLIPISEPERWQAALRGLQDAPSLKWSYVDALQQSLADPVQLYCYSSATGRLAVPLVLRRGDTTDVATLYGSLLVATQGRDPDFAVAFRDFAQSQNWTTAYLACAPDFQSAQWGLEAQTGSASVSLKLSSDEAILLANMQASARYELRRWLAEPPAICTDVTVIRPWLTDVFPAFLQRVGAAPVYHFSEATLARLLGSDTCFAIAAVVSGNVEATSLFVYSGETADYFLNVSHETGRHHSRGLIWLAMRTLHSLGVRQLNLGGGVRAGDSLFSFKQRFGGEVVSMQTIKLVFDSKSYEAACGRAGCSADHKGYFPPYLIPAGA